MKFGPSNQDDLFSLNAAHDAYKKLEKLRKEVWEAEKDFFKKSCDIRYKIKNSFLAQDKKLLSVEEYSALENDPAPGGYCGCKNCRNGHYCS